MSAEEPTKSSSNQKGTKHKRRNSLGLATNTIEMMIDEGYLAPSKPDPASDSASQTGKSGQPVQTDKVQLFDSVSDAKSDEKGQQKAAQEQEFMQADKEMAAVQEEMKKQEEQGDDAEKPLNVYDKLFGGQVFETEDHIIQPVNYDVMEFVVGLFPEPMHA